MTSGRMRGIPPMYPACRDPSGSHYGHPVSVITVPLEGLPAAVARALDGGPPIRPVSADQPAGEAVAGPVDADVAIVVATSGSTGTAKQVLLGRAALLASAAATQQRLGGPGAWSCPLPTHHVAGLMTIVRARQAGLPWVPVAADLSDLRPLPGVRNYLSLVAAQLHRALDDPATAARLAAFDGVLVGGSSIDPTLLARGRALGLSVVASYGMTETCGGCVYDGVPLAGVEVCIGGEGRIALRGPVLMAGYLGQPAATAAVLRDGWFHTQDRGELAPDGTLTVVGRLDEVVISGGVNVDLARAQQLSDARFGTDQVVILAVPDDRFGVRIVAVTTSALTLAQLRDALSPVLSGAALPRELRRVAALPLTGGAKVDRRRLVRDWAERGGAWPQ